MLDIGHWTFLWLLLPGVLTGQAGARDDGRLVVRRGDAVVGEEQFSVEVTRDADGAIAINLLVSANYPSDGARRAAATFGARRITVRVSGGGTEVAREYPRGGRDLVFLEGLLGLLALAGQLEPGAVTLFLPPAPGRQTGSLESLGEERLEADGPLLRHVALRGGGPTVDLWFDGRNRLVRVAIPDQGIVADRTPRP
jgi:hypothetical protein